ncbi:NADP-dependent malic enzyme-like [Arachis ipaensis]|uniref:NADP-dependent malic enzyme-like n=1 Tax=Arachis ipaensis TaxID=130454 RepID=UPI000A2B68BC|nr:NADP-dependent malic enzyme-like [Arachis ipaensis]
MVDEGRMSFTAGDELQKMILPEDDDFASDNFAGCPRILQFRCHRHHLLDSQLSSSSSPVSVPSPLSSGLNISLAFSRFYSDKGRVLSEEEQAKENVYIKFEDFANHNAFDLLEKYSSSHLVFNDDIQGTTSMVLEGLLASLKLVRGSLADHTFLLLGAREAGTGIAELIAREISKQTKAPVEETCKKIWLVDSIP